jgi:hypothetical protein
MCCRWAEQCLGVCVCVCVLTVQGLWDAQKNIRALRSTGGNVEAAIELIFSGQLDNAPQ